MKEYLTLFYFQIRPYFHFFPMELKIEVIYGVLVTPAPKVKNNLATALWGICIWIYRKGISRANA